MMLSATCGVKAKAKMAIPGIVIAAAKAACVRTTTRLIVIVSPLGPEYCMQRTTTSSTSELSRICTLCARVKPRAPRKKRPATSVCESLNDSQQLL